MSATPFLITLDRGNEAPLIVKVTPRGANAKLDTVAAPHAFREDYKRLYALFGGSNLSTLFAQLRLMGWDMRAQSVKLCLQY